jgi:polysaccharide deacetylase 2 family uncharacterized protein YibQ
MFGRLRLIFAGWWGLARAWMVLLGLLGAVAATLQTLGPPMPHLRKAEVKPAAPADAAPEPRQVIVEQRPAAIQPQDRPGRDVPGVVADPDPGLLESNPAARGEILPRISSDGRMPMQVYAAPFDRETKRARVGLIVAGIGMNEADSIAAAQTLPSGVTLAVSPYAEHFQKSLSAARIAGHEYLISLPMEPEGFPLNDPGIRALMTNQPPTRNLEQLNWVLSRIGGYVGVTSILGPMRGERFSLMTDQMDAVHSVLRSRGLLYIDARPGQARSKLAWSVSVDLFIDEPVSREALDARLEELSRLAKDRGSALGVASAPRPMTLERIAAWTNSLNNRGLVLAPVTALVEPPVAGIKN